MSMRDSSNLVNVQTTASPITVMLPDGTTAISTHTALLNVPSLPLSCRLVHIFPHWHGPLLSIGLLCDAGMIAIYTAANVLILDSAGNLVLHGSRSPVDKIWLIDVSGPPPSRYPQTYHFSSLCLCYHGSPWHSSTNCCILPRHDGLSLHLHPGRCIEPSVRPTAWSHP